MSFQLTMPLERGQTLPGAGQSVSTTDLTLPNLEGITCIDEDKDYSSPGQPKLSEEKVYLRLVRNMLVTNVLPKQVCLIEPTTPGRTTTALAGADVSYGVVADEYLPAAGVRPGELFWVVEAGPTKAIAAGAIVAGADIGTAATGKVDDAAATKGLGYAIGSAAANNDTLRVYLRPKFK